MHGMYMNGIAWGFGLRFLVMLLVAAIIILPPFWKIFSKAGFSGWISLLMLIPMLNLIVLYVVAFSDWSSLGYGQQKRSSDRRE